MRRDLFLRILRIFLSDPKISRYPRELIWITGSPASSVYRVLGNLEKKGLLRKINQAYNLCLGSQIKKKESLKQESKKMEETHERTI